MAENIFRGVPKKDGGDHPECAPDEIFIGNHHQAGFRELPWKTKRAGNVAYDDRGNPVDDAQFFPVFVKRAEYQQKS
ncbi:MAG: hypothetical protein HYZ11_07150 [Candidatus Tectomicrobia bacterium]|uniref:Uncharacterized protein n=1 Tax=Tectimicrobiota bacterium TaxID=2528274 RepID=A0A932HX76_UNCTE|nr:hypothetical protein [Candidatus Tectomicrobia bacterium]